MDFLRNRPAGDKDLMLNLVDFTGSGEGEDGRIDCRKLDREALGGEIDRTGAGAGAEALMVGPVGPSLMEDLMANPPPCLGRARLR